MTPVLAGNLDEYYYYCNTHDDSTLFLHTANQLHGRRNFKIIKTGTWWNNPIFKEITVSEFEYLVKIRGIILVYE